MNNDITGRDHYILTEALANAIVLLSKMRHPPDSDIADMKEILAEWYPDGGFAPSIAIAERRFEMLER
jgi:hypothetical protein